MYRLGKAFKRALVAENCPLANGMRDRAMRPEVGDYVVEYTHIYKGGAADELEAAESAVGRLVSVTVEDGDTVYVIEGMTGQTGTWRNAAFFTIVPRFGWPP